jgi:hypothetical protein
MASTATADACGTGGSPAISGSSPSSATSTGRVGALLVAGAWVGDWGYYGDIPPTTNVNIAHESVKLFTGMILLLKIWQLPMGCSCC